MGIPIATELSKDATSLDRGMPSNVYVHIYKINSSNYFYEFGLYTIETINNVYICSCHN